MFRDFLQKIIIKIQANLIKNKKERSIFRNEKLGKIEEKALNISLSKQKWGVSYSVFDGEELLEASIKSIRAEADYVNVVYQKISWYGEEANPDLVDKLLSLKEKGLIDEIIEFKPNLKLAPSKNEKIKRNLGLKYAKKASCTYFMPIGVDEFYKSYDLKWLKREILKNKLTHCYGIITHYWYKPTDRNLEPANYGVTLFSKINMFTKFSTNKKTPLLVDPTRVLNDCLGSKYMVFPNVSMHHMSSIRKDLNKKLKNSSNEGLRALSASYEIGDNKIVKVENIFGINTDWDN